MGRESSFLFIHSININLALSATSVQGEKITSSSRASVHLFIRGIGFESGLAKVLGL